MRLLARILSAVALAAVGAASSAQVDAPTAKWSAQLEPADARPGEHARVIVTGEFSEGAYVYSPEKPSEMIELEISAVEGAPYTLEGDPLFPKPHYMFDKGFKTDVAKFKGGMSFGIPIKLADDAKPGKYAVDLTFQVCNDRLCANPATEKMEFTIASSTGAARVDFAAASTEVPEQPASYVVPEDKPAPTTPTEGVDKTGEEIQKAKESGVFSYFIMAFVAGLLALLTPCVWPMIPVTVSFFSKSAGDNKKNLQGAIAYCLGIIGTFTALGLIVTAIFGASGVQQLAANVWVNLFLALLFIVLAANLFGVFEIYVPSGVVNKLQKKGGKGSGFVGPVLMGLAFSLTSFTCTVPFAGTVLAGAAAGDWFYPIIGMLGFSLAFALPFFLLALFPNLLAKMPQSGTWLVTVKAYLAFVELAAALKFVSNVDLVKGLGILPKEIFLAIWAALFAMAGLYLIGWIKLPKDQGTNIGIPRRVVGVANIGLAFYWLAAIQGAPLGSLSGFMPSTTVAERNDKLPWVYSYESAKAAAIAENQLLFINFTGVTCTNCRVMESEVFPSKDVRAELEQFKLAELFTDRDSAEDRANAVLREKLTNAVTNPIYVVMDPKTEQVLKVYQGLAPNNGEFIKFLQDGRAAGSAVASR